MAVFQVSKRAQQRNEKALGVVYLTLVVLLAGGFALAVIGGLAWRIVHAL